MGPGEVARNFATGPDRQEEGLRRKLADLAEKLDDGVPQGMGIYSFAPPSLSSPFTPT
jgi:hypothetical protein